MGYSEVPDEIIDAVRVVSQLLLDLHEFGPVHSESAPRDLPLPTLLRFPLPWGRLHGPGAKPSHRLADNDGFGF